VKRSSIVLRLRLHRRDRVRWVLVHVQGRRTVRARVKHGGVRVSLRGLAAGTHGIAVVARTRAGRRVVAVRRLRTC